ncbi:hypothetical protein D3C71_1669350 [compost metagenome]
MAAASHIYAGNGCHYTGFGDNTPHSPKPACWCIDQILYRTDSYCPVQERTDNVCWQRRHLYSFSRGRIRLSFVTLPAIVFDFYPLFALQCPVRWKRQLISVSPPFHFRKLLHQSSYNLDQVHYRSG